MAFSVCSLFLLCLTLCLLLVLLCGTVCPFLVLQLFLLGRERAGRMAFIADWTLCCCYLSLPQLREALGWSVVIGPVKQK